VQVRLVILVFLIISDLWKEKYVTLFKIDVKYLSVIFDKRFTWKIHIEMIEAKAFRTFIRLPSLFRSERLSANIKLTLHKAQIRSVITYACSVWEFAEDTLLLKMQGLQNKVYRAKVHTSARVAHGFPSTVYLRLHNEILQATSRIHTKS
jgi:hypothetical protein